MRHFALAAIALLLPVTAAAFDVTQCHQTVPTHATGVLQTDLTCDANGPNVTLQHAAILELNGHTISGGYIGISTDPSRGGRAIIRGPGDVTGATGDPFGAAIAAGSAVLIENVTLHDNSRGIVAVYDFPMKLDGVIIRDNAAKGITSYYGTLNGAAGPGRGLIEGRNLTVTGNGGDGIEGFGKLKLRDSMISGNGAAGIRSHGRKFSVDQVTVTDNDGAGLVSTSQKHGKVKRSTLTGNGPGGDIAAPIAPRLIESTCDHSVDTQFGGNLGICTGD